MTPDVIFIIAICFIALLLTHYLALKMGFEMGSKADFNKILSKPAKEKKYKKSEYVDPYKKEMLDFD